jgi:hypothetical protein
MSAADGRISIFYANKLSFKISDDSVGFEPPRTKMKGGG